MAYIFPQPKKKWGDYDRRNVVPQYKAAEAFEEGTIVAFDATEEKWKRYDPDAENGGLALIHGVVVKDDVEADKLANVAVQGYFGSVFAFIKMTDTFTIQDDGGGNPVLTLTLRREPWLNEIGKIEGTVTVAGSETTDYTIDGKELTLSEGNIGDEVVVEYKGVFEAEDFVKALPGIVLVKVEKAYALPTE